MIIREVSAYFTNKQLPPSVFEEATKPKTSFCLSTSIQILHFNFAELQNQNAVSDYFASKTTLSAL